MTFEELLETAPAILTEGAVIERIRREHPDLLHPDLANALMPMRESEAAVLGAIYRGYVEVACRTSLPMIVSTPTWKASGERLLRAGLNASRINRAACEFLRRIVAEFQPASSAPLLLCGLMGPAGDAYRPEEALPEEKAAQYHREQARELAAVGVDLLMAATLPAVTEARGMARALGGNARPYLISFLLLPNGRLPDGATLDEAIASVDEIEPRQAGFLLNCVHPSVPESMAESLPAAARRRLAGLQANTSRQPPQEREGLPELETEDAQTFAESMIRVKRALGLRILGGCCGTSTEHIRCLATRLTPQV